MAFPCLTPSDWTTKISCVVRSFSHGPQARIDGGILECPKHNGRSDVTTGEAVRLPAQKPLRTYPVTERDGRLMVCMSGSGAPLGELHVRSSLKGA
jgi:Rieske Fe-S protein